MVQRLISSLIAVQGAVSTSFLFIVFRTNELIWSQAKPWELCQTMHSKLHTDLYKEGNINPQIKCQNRKHKIEETYTVRKHCKKELAVFPSPAGMSLIKLFLGGNNLIFPVQGEFDQ
jgi:hypothetical protein